MKHHKLFEMIKQDQQKLLCRIVYRFLIQWLWEDISLRISLKRYVITGDNSIISLFRSIYGTMMWYYHGSNWNQQFHHEHKKNYSILVLKHLNERVTKIFLSLISNKVFLLDVRLIFQPECVITSGLEGLLKFKWVELSWCIYDEYILLFKSFTICNGPKTTDTSLTCLSSCFSTISDSTCTNKNFFFFSM